MEGFSPSATASGRSTRSSAATASFCRDGQPEPLPQRADVQRPAARRLCREGRRPRSRHAPHARRCELRAGRRRPGRVHDRLAHACDPRTGGARPDRGRPGRRQRHRPRGGADRGASPARASSRPPAPRRSSRTRREMGAAETINYREEPISRARHGDDRRQRRRPLHRARGRRPVHGEPPQPAHGRPARHLRRPRRRDPPIDIIELFRNEWEVLGSRIGTPAEMELTMDLLAEGRLRPPCTRRFRWPMRPRRIGSSERREQTGKVMLVPSGTDRLRRPRAQPDDYVSIYTRGVDLDPSRTCLVVVDMMYATGHPRVRARRAAHEPGQDAARPSTASRASTRRCCRTPCACSRGPASTTCGGCSSPTARRSSTTATCPSRWSALCSATHNRVGMREHELLDELEPCPTERVINKITPSAFTSSPFELIMRTYGVDTLLFTGVSTNMCVEGDAARRRRPRLRLRARRGRLRRRLPGVPRAAVRDPAPVREHPHHAAGDRLLEGSPPASEQEAFQAPVVG